MNGAGDDLFAGAGFASNQHRQVRRGDASHQLHYFDECRADANQINIGRIHRRLSGQFVTDLLPFTFCDAATNRLRDALDVGDFKRLHQIVVCAGRNRIQRAYRDATVPEPVRRNPPHALPSHRCSILQRRCCGSDHRRQLPGLSFG